MKIAYLCEPQFGGTYSFFKRLRPRLAGYGMDFRCIPPVSAERFAGTPFEKEEGVDYVRFPENDPKEATRVLITYLNDQQYDAVLVLPGTDMVCTNLVRFLPRCIRTAARVPMITRGTYAPARALAPSLDIIFAVSHRVSNDLVDRYRVPEDSIRVIYNGVEIRDIPSRRHFGQDGRPFHLLYSGRLSDIDKGVLLLPRIVRSLDRKGIPVRLTLMGEGPDEKRLRTGFERFKLQDRVRMTGNIALAEVDDLLAETDCFVLPSRFEGCPNALLEAMAAGCPSVSARIRGSVDRIVEEGKSGLLAEVASTASFVESIAVLADDPEKCAAMGHEARRRIQNRFTADHMAKACAEAFEFLRSTPDRRKPVKSLDRYDVPVAMRPTWRTRVPVPIKNWARKWMERAGISS